jgi:hypothetical protein
LANSATVVSEVSGVLLDLVAYWVQTLSDFDILIGKTMSGDWAKEICPLYPDGDMILHATPTSSPETLHSNFLSLSHPHPVRMTTSYILSSA